MHSVGIAGKGCCVGVPGSVSQLRYRSQRARRAVANSGAHPNGVTPKGEEAHRALERLQQAPTCQGHADPNTLRGYGGLTSPSVRGHAIVWKRYAQVPPPTRAYGIHSRRAPLRSQEHLSTLCITRDATRQEPRSSKSLLRRLTHLTKGFV